MSAPEEPTTDADAPIVSSTQGPEAGDKTDPQLRVPVHGRRLPVPWGLLVALGVYGAAVLFYVWQVYWSSPEYQSALHWYAASELWGDDGGRSAQREALEESYRHLLEAARLKPEVKSFHEELESLNWRFDERGWKVPEDLRHNAEAVAMLWRNIQDANEPILVVGFRDRGWAPDQLVEGPARVLRWSPIGALLIFALWGYSKFSARRVRDQEKEAELQKLEAEVEALGKFRERAPARPKRPTSHTRRTPP